MEGTNANLNFKFHNQFSLFYKIYFKKLPIKNPVLYAVEALAIQFKCKTFSVLGSEWISGLNKFILHWKNTFSTERANNWNSSWKVTICVSVLNDQVIEACWSIQPKYREMSSTWGSLSMYMESQMSKYVDYHGDIYLIMRLSFIP